MQSSLYNTPTMLNALSCADMQQKTLLTCSSNYLFVYGNMHITCVKFHSVYVITRTGCRLYIAGIPYAVGIILAPGIIDAPPGAIATP